MQTFFILTFFQQEECFEALESISQKINYNDADIRSHVVLSMIKVSAVLADIPPMPKIENGGPRVRKAHCLLLIEATIAAIFLTRLLLRF